MTAKPISQLTAATSVGDNDLTVLVQSGASLKISRSLLLGSGENTQSGNYSTVFGWFNTVNGNNSTAVGANNTTSGYNTTAIGQGNHATHSTATAAGYENTASGEYSGAFGSYNTASGPYSVAIGKSNTANDHATIALGRNNTASGYASTAIGQFSTASATYSIAAGYRASASAYGATSFGAYNTASTNRSTAVGFDNTANGGNGATAIGKNNTATGYNAIAIGVQNNATHDTAIAAGYENSASGEYSNAFGAYNTASANRSSAIGFRNIASGNRASAIGFGNTTSGNSATAAGYENTVSGNYGSAFGAYNTISGNYSSSIGFSNTISGDYATVIGVQSKSTGKNGLAIGKVALSIGDSTQAIGSLNLSGPIFWEAGTHPIETSTATIDAEWQSSFRIGDGGNTAFNTIVGLNSKNQTVYVQVFGYGNNNGVYRLASVSQAGGQTVLNFDSVLATNATTYTEAVVKIGSQIQWFSVTDILSVNTGVNGTIVMTGAEGVVGAASLIAHNIPVYIRPASDPSQVYIVSSVTFDGDNTTFHFPEGTTVFNCSGTLYYGASIYYEQEPNNSGSLIGTVVGTGSGYFAVTTDINTAFQMSHYLVADEGSNNGVYTISKANNVAPNDVGISVQELLPSEGTADGVVSAFRYIPNARWLSAAVGFNNNATEFYTSAIGVNNTVSAHYSAAIGNDNTASGPYSNVAGSYNTASGFYATAFGVINQATDQSAVAFGNNNIASAYHTGAVGKNNHANDRTAQAFGISNTASGEYAIAFGGFNTASGIGSSAIGYENQATGEGSTACGYDNSASTYQSCVFGAYNTASGEEKNTAIGWNNTANDRHCSAVGFHNTTSNNYSNAFGYQNTASGFVSSAFGASTQATQQFASAFGALVNATGYASTACGYSSTAGARYATVLGAYNNASGQQSTAVGYSNNTSDDQASAIGFENNAQNYRSSAIGANNTTSANYSSAFGLENTASGERANAFGDNNTVSGHYSSAFGYNNSVSGYSSIVVGFENTVTGNNNQVFGHYNTAITGNRNSVFGFYNTAKGFSGITYGVYNTSSDAGAAIGGVDFALGLRSNAIGQYNFANTNQAQSFGMQNFAGDIRWDNNTYDIASTYQNQSAEDQNCYINVVDSSALIPNFVQSRANLGIHSFIKITGSSSIDGVYIVEGINYGGGHTNITILGFFPNNADIATGTVTLGSDLVDTGISFSLDAVSTGSPGAYINGGDAQHLLVQSFIDKGIPVYFYADGGNLSVYLLDHIEIGEGIAFVTFEGVTGGASGNVHISTQVAWKENTCDESFERISISGLATNQSFAISGDWLNYFNNAEYVWISDDSHGTSNNGIYTVVPVDGVSFNGTYTFVNIEEVMPNGSESDSYGNILAGTSIPKLFHRQVAIGHRNIATGDMSTAMGVNNSASANSTTAIGTDNTVNSCFAQAIGYTNTASGQSSIAIGALNTASGENAIAIGRSTTSSYYRTMTVGDNCTASEYEAVAVGINNHATAAWAASFGVGNTGSGYYSTTVGSFNTASGEYAVAAGYQNQSTSDHTTTAGYKNTASASDTTAIGRSNHANQPQASALGHGNTASCNAASAFGFDNNATNFHGSAFGGQNTASGTYSSAFGQNNTASQAQTSAFGHGNTASGITSSAFGHGNTAQATHTSAVGSNNTAQGNWSSVFGNYNTASGSYSSVFGSSSTVSGAYSTAAGYAAIARINNTVNIGGSIIIRRDNDEDNIYEAHNFAGVENVIMSRVIDLTAGGGPLISLPAGSSFFPNEVGLIITHGVNVTVQPTITFGDETASDDLVSATQTTGLTAFNNRQRFTSLSNYNGHTSLGAAITIGATADNLTGRFYWKGMLVEDTVVEVPQFNHSGDSYISPRSETLHSDTIPDTNIYYTTNGDDPTPGSTLYTGTFDIYTSETIKALAVSSRGQWSDISSPQVYNMTVATPYVDNVGDTYQFSLGVNIYCNTGGASIYYTLDGSTPDNTKILYTGSIGIGVSETLKAIALLAGANDSDIMTEIYTLVVPDPLFDIGTGTYNSNQTVTITDVHAVYYTIDNSTPDGGSTLYTGPISVTLTQTIKAIALESGWTDSNIISNTYTLVVPDPLFDIGTGSYDNDQTITITSSHAVYYTIDNSTPDGGSALYTGPISVAQTQTIKAIALESGWTDSNVISNTYTLVCATPTFSPIAGTYGSTQSVTISSNTLGATIYYTTNGDTPTSGDTIYSVPFDVTASETVKAFAAKAGYSDSSVGSAVYVIDDVLPIVTTDDLISHFNFTATAYGTVVSEGSTNLTVYGFVWNTTGSPTLSDNVVAVDTGSFTGAYNQLVGGLPGTTVYFAAYATNGAGTSYGSDIARYTGPCLIKGTKVTLTNGTKKNIEDITYNDELLVWNFDEGKLDSAKPVWIVTPWKALEYALVKFSNGSELGTVNDGKGHRIFNMEKGEFTHLMNEDTQIGTSTYTENGEVVSVVSRERVKEPSTIFYNIITDKHINLFANGILTSTGLNNIYPIVNMKFIKQNRMVCWSKEDFVGIPEDIFNGFRLSEQPMDYPGIQDKIDRLVKKQQEPTI